MKPFDSGKSTLLNSLLQLLDLSNGSILVDGVDIATVAKQEFRSRLVTLPQDSLSLHVSIRDYARIHGVPGDDHIIRGLSEIGIWDTIEPNGGLDMILKDDTLSHSQRRLLAVAVACLRDGRIVLLDEPTGQ